MYLDRKVASVSNGFTSHSALDIPVKNKKETKGFYYMLYSDCDKKLIEKFEKINGKVFLYKSGIGQYDVSNKLVNQFSSKYDCARTNKISDRIFSKILDKNIIRNGYSYKTNGSKTVQIL